MLPFFDYIYFSLFVFIPAHSPRQTPGLRPCPPRQNTGQWLPPPRQNSGQRQNIQLVESKRRKRSTAETLENQPMRSGHSSSTQQGNINKLQGPPSAGSYAQTVKSAQAVSSVPIATHSRWQQNVGSPHDGVENNEQSLDFAGLQARLAAIPNLRESFKKFEQFVSALESAASEQERQRVMIKHLT